MRIERIEVLGYRCLNDVSLPVGDFHLVAGSIGAGKSTLLDAIEFLSELVGGGSVRGAVDAHTGSSRELTWRGRRSAFELAVDVSLSAELREQLSDRELRSGRYQVRVGQTEAAGEVGILDETFLLTERGRRAGARQSALLPEAGPETIFASHRKQDRKTVVRKVADGNDHFYDETGSGWDPTFPHGPEQSALANVPDDDEKFPAALCLRRLLADGVRPVRLDDESLRCTDAELADGEWTAEGGAGLGRAIDRFRRRAPGEFRTWRERLREHGVDLVVREEEEGSGVGFEETDDFWVPLGAASTGTLRFVALALSCEVAAAGEWMLVEEPERGLDVERARGAYDYLSGVSGAQVLAATQAPELVDRAEEGEVLRAESHAGGVRTITRVGAGEPPTERS